MSLIASTVTPSIASADNWSVSARAETGFQYYSFEQSPQLLLGQVIDIGNGVELQGETTLDGLEIADTMPLLGGGLSVAVGRFFIDASIQGTFNGSDSADRSDIQSTQALDEADPSFAAVGRTEQAFNQDYDFDREEYALSVGYAVTDNFAVFGGWKWATTSFDIEATGNSVTTIANSSVPQAFRSEYKWKGKLEQDFDQDGPFIGAAYSWDLNKPAKGALTVKAALAFLDGEINIHSNNAVGTFPNGQTFTGELIAAEFEGNTEALTLGVRWIGETNIKGLTYTLGVNGYTYNFDADSLTRGQPGQPNAYRGSDGGDITETVVNFSAGIAYRF
jgi:hypothetical protein